MFTGHRCLRIVALTDMSLAISICSYVGFQIAHGPDLIPGSLSETEKIARLVVYAALIYLFLGIQLYTALQLMRTSRQDPLQSLRIITMWLEWSYVFLLFIAIHGFTALLLMKGGTRKSTILVLSTVQVLFRVSGIAIVSKHYYILPPEPLKV